ncbi:MAG: hypothetical protein K1X71_19535 [Pirellulales bacterium]|jgi:hypothetical protein|nr:hypothetical protein [Pirellulales bacterium]
MVETTELAPSFLFLGLIQLAGVVSAIAAHRSSGTASQGFCQLISLACMGFAGLSALLSLSAEPGKSLFCGAFLAVTMLTATFDRCGFGLAPATSGE